jgi:RecJ-like exonuclease
MRTVAVVLVALLSACRSTSSTPDGVRIGGEIHTQQSVRFSVVEAQPDQFVDQTLLIEGTVQAVCQKRGCWMQIADGGGGTAMARWAKGCGSFAFPMDSVGKRVLVQGAFYRKTFSQEAVEHMQSEAGRDLEIARDGYELATTAVIVLDERD